MIRLVKCMVYWWIAPRHSMSFLSFLGCTVLSTLIVTLIGDIVGDYWWIKLLGLVVGGLVVYVFSPIYDCNRPNEDGDEQ